MHASRILFNWNLAFWASMSSNNIGPSLIKLFLCLITWLSLVPFSCAIKAHISFASIAFNFLGVLRCLYYLLAWCIGAKLFVIRYCNFMILSELLKFFIRFRINNCLYHVFCNYFAAALLRTFESVALSRLLNLILKEIFVRIFTKLVTALYLGNEEFTFWMVFVADLAKFLATSLKILLFFSD